MQKITPFLWFDGQAEEAVQFYTAIFKNSKIVSIMRYGEAGPGRRARSCPRRSSSTVSNSSH
jgi:predicted 3-demethylubiquinone-9 3-methyltransferase (glyoxalase superfamily)